MTTSVGHIQPRRHLDKLEGRLVYWRMFHHPMLHRLPSNLGEPGLGNLFLPTHFFTSSSGSISWGCSWYLSPSPQKAQKREPREGEIASSNCSGAGLVDKTCQSHQVCLTGPPLQRLTWLQGTEATGRESVNLCCPWMAVPWALCMNLHKERSIVAFMKANAIYMWNFPKRKLKSNFRLWYPMVV